MRKKVSILAFLVRLPTKRNYKAMKSLQASFMRFLLQALVSARSFSELQIIQEFSAWFCTTRTPKLLTWLKNVLIRHTFVLKFVQNESAIKELHINQAKVNFNSGFDIIFDNIGCGRTRRVNWVYFFRNLVKNSK